MTNENNIKANSHAAENAGDINDVDASSLLEMDEKMISKLSKLQSIIEGYGKLAVGFSGGVDSTFLLSVSAMMLGDDVTAITAKSPAFSSDEHQEAVEFAKALDVKHVIVETDELALENFAGNPPDRCYHCKTEIFGKIMAKAAELGITYVADGTNVDDLNDYRPGMKASEQMKVVKPMLEAGLTKKDIRILSKAMDLPNWNKPAAACLASRFAYGERITAEKLKWVDDAEKFLREKGFKQVRVRIQDRSARIEVGKNERARFFDAQVMDEVHDALKKIGFSYISLDLKGYRTGSMNEVL